MKAIDKAIADGQEALVILVEEHPTSYMRGGTDEHFCDAHECDWYADRDARFEIAAKKALPQLVGMLTLAKAELARRQPSAMKGEQER